MYKKFKLRINKKTLLVIITLIFLFCTDSKNEDILLHINNINTAEALLNVHKFKESNYYKEKIEIEFAKAVAVSNRKKIDQLLKDGVDINSLGTDSISYLAWSFIKFQKNSFKYLLEQGASIDLKLKGGNTIFSFAKLQNDKFYLDMLLEYE